MELAESAPAVARAARMKRILILLAAVSGIAFGLHLAWEYLQCGPFFIHGALRPSNVAMIMATLGDVAMTIVAYVAVSAVSRSLHWPLSRWGVLQWVALEVCAVSFALGIEWMGLAMGRWAYTDLAPRLPGMNVSLLPILQLVILFPLTFDVAARITRRLQWRLPAQRRQKRPPGIAP